MGAKIGDLVEGLCKKLLELLILPTPPKPGSQMTVPSNSQQKTEGLLSGEAKLEGI